MVRYIRLGAQTSPLKQFISRVFGSDIYYTQQCVYASLYKVNMFKLLKVKYGDDLCNT